MSGFKNDVVFAKNADFSAAANTSPSESNGLATNGQLWVGTTALNGGGTHVNVGTITSPDNSITLGYSSPNITETVNIPVIRNLLALSVPSFAAHLGATVNNVTGDGTAYDIIFDQEDHDQNSNYDPTTGIFTAPVVGKYHFSAGSYTNNQNTTFGFSIALVATGITLNNNFNYAGAGTTNQTGIVISGVISMAAGDTCKVVQTNSFGGKDNSITNTAAAGAGNATFFTGFLIC